MKQISSSWGRVIEVLFGLTGLVLALSISWVLLAQGDFFYSIWLDHGNIAESIDKYGAQNRYKAGFADTTAAQRSQLFSQINTAVHHGGLGLSEISYESSSSLGLQKLLRVPEVIHLQDVATLIQRMTYVVMMNAGLWVLASVYLLFFRRIALRWGPHLWGAGVLFIAITLAMAIVGPEQVFNQLHIWVFPKEHQWFFYYQESLMSTMMLAPLLFAYIAVIWCLFALVTYLVLFLFCRRAQGYLASR